MAMKPCAFSSFHPLVNFAYFAAVIGFSMVLMHPVSLVTSLALACVYLVQLGGLKSLKSTMKYLLPMMIFTAALNPLFNHQGATILAYLPNGNPVTLESATFGAAAAVMLASVVLWFACFNLVITSDKFVYLFGRIIPALSLVLAVALRFVPRFRAQITVVVNAQKCIGKGASDGGGIIAKVRHAAAILSIMVTWALENAIETSDSMKNRGYGLPGRTAFSIFRFERRDAYALLFICVCTAVIVAAQIMGVYHFRYFPTIRGQWTTIGALAMFAVYFALLALPVGINLKEAIHFYRCHSGLDPESHKVN